MPSTLMLLSNPFRPDPRVLIEGRALTASGIKVHLISWDREGGRPKRGDEEGLEVIRLGPATPARAPFKILGRLPIFWLKALNACKSVSFDVVHAHDFDTLPLGFLIARLSRRPLLYDAHELYAKMIKHEVGPLSKPIWWWERRCARRATAVITVSETLADSLSSGRKDRARVVSTSQDPSILKGVNVGEMRKKYGLKGFTVSYLGSLEPGRFVEEFASSFEPGDGVTMVVGGTGTLQTRIERMTAEKPALRFIGVVDTDEALRISYASDLVVAMMDPSNPNNVVGTPGKIINAMACGRPVITTRGLQIAEKIEKAGAGIVVPYEKAAFRDAVLKAAKDPRNLADMGRKGRDLYDREFSWEKSKNELLRAYQALLGIRLA